jgi:hypothetical protein
MRAVHTLRGIVPGSTKQRIFDNDLRNVGWKIKEFYLWPNNMDVNPYVWAKLWIGNDTGGSLGFSDAGDNRAIAWASASGSTAEALRWSVIDPDHIITNTLSVHSGSPESVAYLIVLEQMTLSDDEEIMALIKERSQDDI